MPTYLTELFGLEFSVENNMFCNTGVPYKRTMHMGILETVRDKISVEYEKICIIKIPTIS